MTTYYLKTGFQKLLRPLSNRIHQAGVSPNQVTLAAFALSLLYSLAVFIFKERPIIFFLFPIIYLVRMILNAIDGMIAKEKNRTTILGATLNEVCDVISDLSWSLTLIYSTKIHSNYMWAFIYLSLFVEYSGILSALNGKRSYAGPMGKSDRGIMLVFVYYLVAWELLSQRQLTAYINNLLLVSLILLLITAINRIRTILK